MTQTLLRILALAAVLAVGAPDLARADEPAEGPRIARLLAQLAPPPADERANACAECFADCSNRYGRACSLLCHYGSVCLSLCADRRRECNAECNDALSCWRRPRSCSLPPERRATILR